MRSARPPSTQIRQGDYFCSARELYHVEHVAAGHVLLEDCRSGDLVDVPIGQLLKLTRLPEPGGQAAPAARGQDDGARLPS
jgi:hypothetical protein